MPVSSLAPDDFAWLPATEQLAALDAKDVSSAELVELYLSRISTHNPSLNAIVTVDPDAARRAATRPMPHAHVEMTSARFTACRSP